MKAVKLGTILQMDKGKTPVTQSTEAKAGYMPYVDIEAFETGVVKQYTSGEKCVPCKEGDVLIVCDGSRSGLVGKAIDGYVGSTLAKISAEGVDNQYLYYFLQGKYTLLNTRKKGTGTPHLKPELLKAQKLFVPDYPGQRRIVSRIEELLSQLESGVETLNTVKRQLAAYRHAVLQEAFFSKASDLVELSQLVDDIRIGPFGTMLHKEDYILNGIPVINPQHIKKLAICESPRVTISAEKADELVAYKLQVNDVIMGRRGEMGRVAAVGEREKGWICGTGSILFRLKPEFDANLYVQILSSPKTVHYLEKHATGTTMKNLNEDIVKHIPVPRIDRAEQSSIMQRTDSTLSVCDNTEQTVAVALRQSEAMRQSILKLAFEGEL